MYKLKTFISCLLVITGMTLFSSCTKDNIDEPETPDKTDQTNPSDTDEPADRLHVEYNSLSFDCNGRDNLGYYAQTVKISGSKDYKVACDVSWIDQEVKDDLLTVRVENNNTGEGRKGVITISDSRFSEIITVEQNPYKTGDVVTVDNVDARVFEIDGCIAKVFITTSELCYWGQNGALGEFSSYDGEINEDIVKRIDPTLSEFPAFRACEMAVNDAWYLPAKYELANIYRVNGYPLGSSGGNISIWSSTTTSSDYHVYALKKDGTWDEHGSRLGQRCHVCPARKIQTYKGESTTTPTKG